MKQHDRYRLRDRGVRGDADRRVVRCFQLPDPIGRIRAGKEKLEAERVLGIVRRGYDAIVEDLRKMAAVQMLGGRLTDYMEAVFPFPSDPEDRRGRKRAERNRTFAAHFFEYGEGNMPSKVGGTLWAAYNGVTEMVDHRAPAGQTDDQRLDSMWFGEGYRTKARAYSVAVARAQDWAG